MPDSLLTRWASLLRSVGFTGWRFITAGVVIAGIGPSFLKYGTIRPYDFLTFLSVTVFIVATYYELHHPFGVVRIGMRVVSLLSAIAVVVVVVVGWAMLPFDGGGV